MIQDNPGDSRTGLTRSAPPIQAVAPVRDNASLGVWVLMPEGREGSERTGERLKCPRVPLPESSEGVW